MDEFDRMLTYVRALASREGVSEATAFTAGYLARELIGLVSEIDAVLAAHSEGPGGVCDVISRILRDSRWRTMGEG